MNSSLKTLVKEVEEASELLSEKKDQLFIMVNIPYERLEARLEAWEEHIDKRHVNGLFTGRADIVHEIPNAIRGFSEYCKSNDLLEYEQTYEDLFAYAVQFVLAIRYPKEENITQTMFQEAVASRECIKVAEFIMAENLGTFTV